MDDGKSTYSVYQHFQNYPFPKTLFKTDDLRELLRWMLTRKANTLLKSVVLHVVTYTDVMEFVTRTQEFHYEQPALLFLHNNSPQKIKTKEEPNEC